MQQGTQTLDVHQSGRAVHWLDILLPGLAMSLGWGLRGQYGGPRGTMVPGALVAIALVLVARKRMSVTRFWAALMAGALGFGIGGEMTWGQTMGLTRYADTRLWGYLGLLVKGAVWGGIGGLFIGAALGEKRYTAKQLLVAFNIALAISFLGFLLINEPRLIYFSGGAPDRSKLEGWAGMWFFYLPLLFMAFRANDRTAVRLSLYGMVGCGLGFVLGNLACRLGEDNTGKVTDFLIDWWKVSECSWGFITGSVLGWAWARADQREPAPPTEDRAPSVPALMAVLLGLDLLLFYYITGEMDNIDGWIGMAPFVFTAPALVLVALRRPQLQVMIGAAATIVVTLWNVQSYWVNEHHVMGATVSLVGLIVLAALASVHVARNADRMRAMLLIVAGWTTACAWLKMSLPAPAHPAQTIGVQSIFTVMVLLLALATARLPRGEAPSTPASRA